MIAKKKQLKRVAIKSKPREEYFNYWKKGHYTKNDHSTISNKRKLAEKAMEEIKYSQWKRNEAKDARLINNNQATPIMNYI